MDGTTVRHINPRLLQLLERLDDVSHHAARLLSRILMRKVAAPALVESRDGKRPKLLVHRAIHKLRRKEVDQIVQPCPGIYAVLDLLRDQHVPMGLVSNGLGKGYGHDVLQAFDLEKYFNVTIFREDVARAKPHPDSLIQALRGVGREIRADDVIWYVGDQRKDVIAALGASTALGRDIHPIACGVRAALAIVEHGLERDQVMLTLADLEVAMRSLFKLPRDPG